MCEYIWHLTSDGSSNDVINYAAHHYQNLSLTNRHHHRRRHHCARRIITSNRPLHTKKRTYDSRFTDWDITGTLDWRGALFSYRIVSCRVVSASASRIVERCGSVVQARLFEFDSIPKLCLQVTRNCWRKGPASAFCLALVLRRARATVRQSTAPTRD